MEKVRFVTLLVFETDASYFVSHFCHTFGFGKVRFVTLLVFEQVRFVTLLVLTVSHFCHTFGLGKSGRGTRRTSCVRLRVSYFV